MHATVQNSTRRVTKELTVEDGPIHDDADTQIKVDVIGLTYTDNGHGLNVKASLYGPVLDKDGTPNPTRRVMHIVWNALAEGGWLRELIDEHTPPEFLPEHTLGRKPSPKPPTEPEGTVRRDPVTGLHAMLTHYTNDVPWRSTGKAGVKRWLTHDEVSTWDVVYTPDDSGVL